MNDERTLNNSCSQSLAASGIHKNLKVCCPNIPVQVEFYWDQTSICWNISILHDRGTNHPKSRVHFHPSRFIVYRQFHCVCFRFSMYLKGKPFTQDVIWKGYMSQVISSLLPVSNLIFGENSPKFAKHRFESYNSTANFSIFKIRIFRINMREAARTY